MKIVPKPIDDYAQRVLALLAAGLDKVGSHRRVDNGGPGIMAVSVERIERHAFSVAHYYEQNGDLMVDPEMIFLAWGDGTFTPVYYKQDNLGIEKWSAEWASTPNALVIKDVDISLQAGHAAVANEWLRNIADQQGLTEGGTVHGLLPAPSADDE